MGVQYTLRPIMLSWPPLAPGGATSVPEDGKDGEPGSEEVEETLAEPSRQVRPARWFRGAEGGGRGDRGRRSARPRPPVPRAVPRHLRRADPRADDLRRPA